MLMFSGLVQLFKPGCILPWSELLDKSRYRRWERRAIDGGISPSKLLRLRSRVFKNVRFPMEGVIMPPRPWEVRLSAVTLLCWLQTTPGQWQNVVVVLLVFHASRTPPRWLFMLALNANKASTSVQWLNVVADADRRSKRSNRKTGNIDRCRCEAEQRRNVSFSCHLEGSF